MAATTTISELVTNEGVDQLEILAAVNAYAAREVTLSKAAEIAGISTWYFLALMPAERLELHYGVTEFEQDLQA